MPVIPFIPAALSVGASLIGSKNSSKATNAATAQAQYAADQSNAIAREVRDENKGYLNPYIQQGQAAAGQINQLLATNPYKTSTGATFREDPGYQFRQNEGFDRVASGAALGAGRLSGSALKGLETFRQGLNDQTYGDWWNRDQAELANINNSKSQYLNALGGTRAAGQSSASALAGIGQNYAGQVGQNLQQAANVQGNAALVNANNQNALIGNLMNTGANMYGQYQQSRSSYGGQGSSPYELAARGGWSV